MRTNNAMQLKALIKNKAARSGISAQLVLQNYMLERLLERISLSEHSNLIIIKGGMLIGSLLGLDKRTSMDLDTTVQNFELTHEKALEVFRNICAIQVDDDIAFEVLRCENIRETDGYPGLRMFLHANYQPLSVPLKIDVTTGDKITPSAIEYHYPLLFDDRAIRIMAYPIETVLAEKLETVLSRGVANTRPRDFYDIYMLWSLREKQCDRKTLKEALRATSQQRGSIRTLDTFESIIEEIRCDDQMQRRWERYAKANSYSKDISFDETCNSTLLIMRELNR